MPAKRMPDRFQPGDALALLQAGHAHGLVCETPGCRIESASGALALRAETDILLCRKQVRRLAMQINFSLVEQIKMITAASELARNTVMGGEGGEMRWDFPIRESAAGLRLAFEDHGPGLPNSSGCQDGFGLAGSRRLVDDFAIRTASGEGTCITIVRWK